MCSDIQCIWCSGAVLSVHLCYMYPILFLVKERDVNVAVISALSPAHAIVSDLSLLFLGVGVSSLLPVPMCEHPASLGEVTTPRRTWARPLGFPHRPPVSVGQQV